MIEKMQNYREIVMDAMAHLIRTSPLTIGGSVTELSSLVLPPMVRF